MSSLALQGRVVTETEVWENGTVIIEGSRIRSVTRERVEADESWRMHESYLVPGFVDLQLNGAFGIDTATDPRRLPEFSAKLPKTGTTSYLPTLVTLPLSEYPSLLSEFSLQTGSGAMPLGLHLEGPFINPLKSGAHPEDNVASPDPEALERMLDLADVRIVTAAPELSGSSSLARVANERGVLVSAGHSDASYEEAVVALDSGSRSSARSVTHLFNAMSPLHHRDPGLPGAALSRAEAHCGTIADGRHVHPEMVRLAFERLGPERMYLVTDAMAAAGVGSGEYTLAGHRVSMVDGEPRLEDGTLAGSVLTMEEALRNVLDFTGCSLPEAVRMAATTPARLIGELHKGGLAPGFDADVAVLSPELEVEAVWVGGREAFSGERMAGRVGEAAGGETVLAQMSLCSAAAARRHSHAQGRRLQDMTTAQEQETTVAPEEGLHARPAAKFVHTAKQYDSEIVVFKDGRKESAKSALKLMTLGAHIGDRIVIRAEGEDAEEAVSALVEIISAV